MSKNYDNVRVYADEESAVYLAPKGTPLPVDLATLAAPFEEVGWLSEDGITSGLSTDVNKIKAFQGGKTVRTRVKSTEKTLKFTALETKVLTLEAYYGGKLNPTVTGTGADKIASYSEPESAGVSEYVCVVDKFDGTVHERKCYELISIGERGDIQTNGDSGDFYEYTSDIIGPVEVITNNPAIAGA